MTAIVFIVLFREFMVSSLRLVTAKSGLVVAANIWGKLKTVSQMVGIVVALLFCSVIKDFGLIQSVQVIYIIDVIIIALFWLSAVLCVISGLIYLNECKSYINSSK